MVFPLLPIILATQTAAEVGAWLVSLVVVGVGASGGTYYLCQFNQEPGASSPEKVLPTPPQFPDILQDSKVLFEKMSSEVPLVQEEINKIHQALEEIMEKLSVYSTKMDAVEALLQKHADVLSPKMIQLFHQLIEHHVRLKEKSRQQTQIIGFFCKNQKIKSADDLFPINNMN